MRGSHDSRIARAWTGLHCMVLLLFSSSAHVAEGQTTLVEDGRPVAAIVIGAAATEEERAAADEIRLYVKKMSEAALPIASDADGVRGPKILVGRNRLATKLGVSVRQAIYPAPETMLVKSVDGHVVVAGNDAGTYRGTYFAACALLEHLGVRWYWPSEVGEVVPRRSTVRVPRIARREGPSFPFRLGLWYATGITSDSGPFAVWSRRNRLGGAAIFASHGSAASDLFSVPSLATAVDGFGGIPFSVTILWQFSLGTALCDSAWPYSTTASPKRGLPVTDPSRLICESQQSRGVVVRDVCKRTFAHQAPQQRDTPSCDALIGDVAASAVRAGAVAGPQQLLAVAFEEASGKLMIPVHAVEARSGGKIAV